MGTPFETENSTLTYADAFNNCTSLYSNADDHLPHSICLRCSHEIKKAYAFLYKSIWADKMLRSLNVGDPQQLLAENSLDTLNRTNAYQITDDLAVSPPPPDHPDELIKMDHVISNLDKQQLKSRKMLTEPQGVKEFMFPKGVLECKLCGKAYFTTDGLQQHLRVHVATHIVEEIPIKTSKRRLIASECEICGKILSSPYHLKMHMILHTGERNFLCDFCPKTFTSLHKLRYHQRSHTGERPYQCQQCDKKFSSTTTLNAHARTHTAVRWFPCHICDRQFKQLSTLRAHIKINHTAGALTCVVCSRQFARYADMRIHMRSHTGERPYECTIGMCNRAYVTQANLNWHIKKKHSTQHLNRCSTVTV